MPPLSLMKRSEAALVNACLDYLALSKIFAWRNNNAPIFRVTRRGVGSRGEGYFSKAHPRTPAGLPDIFGILPGGRLLAVECKLPTRKLSSAQMEMRRVFEEAGAVWITAWSLDDLANALAAL